MVLLLLQNWILLIYNDFSVSSRCSNCSAYLRAYAVVVSLLIDTCVLGSGMGLFSKTAVVLFVPVAGLLWPRHVHRLWMYNSREHIVRMVVKGNASIWEDPFPLLETRGPTFTVGWWVRVPRVEGRLHIPLSRNCDLVGMVFQNGIYGVLILLLRPQHRKREGLLPQSCLPSVDWVLVRRYAHLNTLDSFFQSNACMREPT